MRNVINLIGFVPFLIVMFLNAGVDLGHKITIQNILVKNFSGDTLIILSSIINLLILLPFVLAFSLSGFLSDKFSRTTITRICATLEILLTLLITIFYYFGFFYAAFAATILLGLESAIYSPAKYGLIKKLVGAENLGVANGLVQSITIVAILIASLAFSIIFEKYVNGSNIAEMLHSIYFIGIILFILAVVQTIFTFKIPFFEPTDEKLNFDKKKYFKFNYLVENLKILFKSRNLFLCIIGISVFWGMSQLIIATFPAHFKLITGSDNVEIIQFILAVSIIGIIIGSAIAGNYCKKHIEIGMVPFGSFGLFISVLIFANASNIFWMCVGSFAFGFSGGIFIVPLNANIQFFTPEKQMGRVLAGSNFFQNIFMVLFLVFGVMLVYFKIPTNGIFSILAVCMLICTFIAIRNLPHLFTRILVWPLFRLGFKVNVGGVENIPQKGGVLLLGNHISWIDWAMVQIAAPRPIKFAMYKSFYDIWYLRWFFKIFGVIPIGLGVSKSAIEKIHELLNNGEVVALFPEGHISYNGILDEFKSGFELAAKDANAVIVPFYIRGLWGSSFSRANSYYKKISTHGKRYIRVDFGAPMDINSTANEVKNKVIELSFFSWTNQILTLEPMQFNWLKQAKSNLFKTAMIDSTGANLNNLKVITGIILFINKMEHLFKGQKNIGVILPSSVAGSITNLMLFMLGKVSVNLNYTLSEENLIKCVEIGEIKTIISSRKFVEKLKDRGFDLQNSIGNKFIFLEDIKDKISKRDKICALLKALLLPKFMLEFLYFANVKIDDEATILFSSGSEGTPKGVVLTHKNIMANIKQLIELVNANENDAILASLPIFHCFGLTVTTLLPLSEGILSVHVPDPTDAATIGKMSAKFRTTIMFGTSTFFRIYTRSKRINPLMFSSIRFAIAGAEKLNQSTKEDFKMKFGITIYEGYGTTETTPVVCVNTPSILEPEFFQELKFSKNGTVGLPLPGTIVKIVDPDTLKELPVGTEGLVIIGGLQVMKGYYKNDKKTKEVITEIDGVRYYKSGDIGFIDNDGFLTITDRISRFAKIGGEMISLGAVESLLSEIFKDEISFCCTNVDDAKKGEKIIMLYMGEIDESEIKKRILDSKIASIMQPSVIYKIDQIPLLGSGKINLKALKELALKLENEK